ncbi:MAG: bifunctional 5,10-methylenetetrahydrofolate dehydrogenase/5,10-methenyltetrahydrofolate cyclohydrolase, partial [Spirochaetales bacterium]|nr:bifunctional 5,10-methylenetetrahydrofolate dehydrogenase/5,10-methenyltetrahydrofolate cyclohydrolase [Spirochaetales bacterium]
LAVVLVGDNAASQTYVKSKRKSCEELGFAHVDITFESSFSQDELLICIETLNNDPAVDGILIQMPLPSHIDELAITEAVRPDKDVDGFHPQNIGKLLLGQRSLVACTPRGIMRIIDHYGIETAGKKVCIMGRSNIVGKPMAALMMQKGRDATVTVCHSRTPDVATYTREADIVIVAVGHVNALTSDMVKEGAVVIDVGINRVPDSSKKSGFALKGDVDYESVSQKASAITPVPGGVGPMTIAMLMENTILAACWREGIEPEDLDGGI